MRDIGSTVSPKAAIRSAAVAPISSSFARYREVSNFGYSSFAMNRAAEASSGSGVVAISVNRWTKSGVVIVFYQYSTLRLVTASLAILNECF